MARIDFDYADITSGKAHIAGDVFFKLGLQYANGIDVEQDNVTAHKWLNIAAAKGEARATFYRQELAEEMSKAELAKALKLAREWLSVELH